MTDNPNDLIEMYSRAAGRTHEVVANIRKDHLDNPTPCEEWNVAHVLDHLIGGCITVAAGARGEKSAAIGEPGNLGEDYVESFRTASQGAIDAFREPGALDKEFTFPWGDTPAPMALHLALADMVVHGWDVAKGTGQDYEPDADIAEEIYGFVTQMMEPNGEMPRRSAFGPPIDVPQDAPPADKMLAYVGRKP